MTPQQKKRREYFKNGRKLLREAFGGYYYFSSIEGILSDEEADKVENILDKGEVKYNEHPLKLSKWRSYVWSHADIRDKVCKVAEWMYVDK